METTTLAPGIYTLFVLYENGIWEQPLYRIEGEGWTEHAIEAIAINANRKIFYACGVQEDRDADEDLAENLGECP
jgi:hypothetical protein